MKDLSSERKAHIVFTRFTCPDTKFGIKFSLGGLSVWPIVKRVSKEALKIIRNRIPAAIIPGEGVDYDAVVGLERLGITREHVIPVEDLFQYFDGLYRANALTEQVILDFIPKLEIAFITTEENRRFTGGLSKRMPDGWWRSETLDPLDRYRAAGLDDSIWANWEEAAGSDSGPVANADTQEQGRERGTPPFVQSNNNPRNHERRQNMTPQQYFEFWTAFKEWCIEHGKTWCTRSVARRGDYNYNPSSFRPSLHFSISESAAGIRDQGPLVAIAVYCDGGEVQRARIAQFRDEFPATFDFQEWASGTRGARRIVFIRRFDYHDPTLWDNLFSTMANDYESIAQVLRNHGEGEG